MELQQPDGHEVASQTHAPPTHRRPAAHATSVLPHTHAPEEQVSEAPVQAMHAAPPVPHADVALAVQTLPAQQPVGQVIWSHTQAPALQRWPGPHAGLAPQTHEPPMSQALALVGSHEEQAAPLVPQVVRLACWHASTASQQPAQFLELQVPPTHEPFVQVCAALQAGPGPQRQAPAAVQLSAFPAAHAVHAVPGAEQLISESVVQALPTQQPAAQDVASQRQVAPTQR